MSDDGKGDKKSKDGKKEGKKEGKKKPEKVVFKTYYEVLRIESKASSAEVKRAYRREALIWHPDKQQSAGGDIEAANVRFKLIVEAYEVLSDSSKRRMYDNAGWTPGQSPFGAADDAYRPSGRSGFDPMDAFRQWRSWADDIDPDGWFGGGGFGLGGFGGGMEGDWGSDPFEESMEEEEPEEPGFDDSNGFYPPGFKRDPRFRYGSRPMEKPKDFIDPFSSNSTPKASAFGPFGPPPPKQAAAEAESGKFEGEPAPKPASKPAPAEETKAKPKRKLKVKIDKPTSKM